LTDFARLTAQGTLNRNDLLAILGARDVNDIEIIRRAAEAVLLAQCGLQVYLRGLIESSNACACDCLYCGIRKSNTHVNRYTLSAEQMVACARLCSDLGYGSIVLQSGERSDKKFIELTLEALRRIKRETRTEAQPDGLGVTLCIGQQSRETYQRLYDAGAHRYLLRIETTNPVLFARIHPGDQTFESRLACLNLLRDIGYQVGTGVMIGLPGQTLENLADDILFYEKHDIDMIGMGPFIPDPETPLGRESCHDLTERVRLSLLMIAATRLKLRDVNIASTTALQTLDPIGREKGLKFGANVIMPQVTPLDVRKDYQLYPGKPCLDENARECHSCLGIRIASAGRTIGYNVWGDSAHAAKRKAGQRERSAAG
jgi:biotin synthase